MSLSPRQLERCSAVQWRTGQFNVMSMKTAGCCRWCRILWISSGLKGFMESGSAIVYTTDGLDLNFQNQWENSWYFSCGVKMIIFAHTIYTTVSRGGTSKVVFLLLLKPELKRLTDYQNRLRLNWTLVLAGTSPRRCYVTNAPPLNYGFIYRKKGIKCAS